MKTNNNISGYTIIELIVALTILGMVISLAGTSFKLYSGRLIDKKMIYPADAVHFSWLVSSFESLLFYAVESNDEYSDKRSFLDYFKGDKKEVSYITKASITGEKGKPVIHTLKLQDEKIILLETSLYSSDQNYLSPKLETGNTKKISIFEEVKDLAIFYKINDEFVDSLENSVPNYVKFVIRYNDNSEEEFLFNIKSNFINKKNLTYEAKFQGI